ncbi:cytochrome c oxidase assembly protein COX16 homolog, mitochondrial isoform X2 [Orcinus orca]|uniref:cytochrome c oxidase assembly protein COX16 homolog, mitochondrial isoform X2 n=1 Tax=Orcinus orca TaxID=9733 RepID=UPI002112F87E|nr:cytochrome c oxidase assembly protein COX16 homolog, mitochondrial isoform X2 [Orcinus orca]
MLLRIDCFCLAETYLEGPCTGKAKERRSVKDRTPQEGPRATEIREAKLACLAGHPSGSESSVMFAHAVTRALRKNKTLRYGVPTLIDPELEKKLKMNKVSLESEYEKIKDSTFDDWKNIRGPRPWEDPDLLQGQNPEIRNTKTT